MHAVYMIIIAQMEGNKAISEQNFSILLEFNQY